MGCKLGNHDNEIAKYSATPYVVLYSYLLCYGLDISVIEVYCSLLTQ